MVPLSLKFKTVLCWHEFIQSLLNPLPEQLCHLVFVLTSELSVPWLLSQSLHAALRSHPQRWRRKTTTLPWACREYLKARRLCFSGATVWANSSRSVWLDRTERVTLHCCSEQKLPLHLQLLALCLTAVLTTACYDRLPRSPSPWRRNWALWRA